MHATCLALMLVTSCFVGGCGDDGGDGADGPSLCERGCEDTIAADCPTGPSTQAGCVSDCEMLESGSCATEYQAFQDCADGEAITCDSSSGIPVVEACATEQDAFIACLNG